MSADKEEKFDKMLYRALKERSEPVPADFTGRMLKQIKEAEEQKILTRVVMEERLALVGCIALGIMTIVVMTVFPGIAVSFKELAAAFIYRITQTIEAVCYDWQLCTVLVWALGFVVYNLMDLILGDSWQWTRI